MIWIASILVVAFLSFIAYVYWQVDKVKYYQPTEAEIAAERRIMTAEKRHFGRYQLYHERQTKEYKQWLKNLQMSQPNKKGKDE